MAVVEHGAVNHSFMAVGKMLQVLIVGGNHTISLLLAELVEYSFGDSTSYAWLCTCTKLIYQNDGLAIGCLHHILHVQKMR